MRRIVILLSALFSLAACSSGEIGSTCAASASETVCVEGAICASDRSATVEPPADPNADTFHCRQICEIAADCTEPGFECRRVADSMLSACQPEDDGTSDGGV